MHANASRTHQHIFRATEIEANVCPHPTGAVLSVGRLQSLRSDHGVLGWAWMLCVPASGVASGRALVRTVSALRRVSCSLYVARPLAMLTAGSVQISLGSHTCVASMRIQMLANRLFQCLKHHV